MEGKRATELKLVDEVKRIFEVPPPFKLCRVFSSRYWILMNSGRVNSFDYFQQEKPFRQKARSNCMHSKYCIWCCSQAADLNKNGELTFDEFNLALSKPSMVKWRASDSAVDFAEPEKVKS